VLSVTLTPALAALLIRGRIRGEHANPVNRFLVRAYEPILRGHARALRPRAVRAARDHGDEPGCDGDRQRGRRSAARRLVAGGYPGQDVAEPQFEVVRLAQVRRVYDAAARA